MTQENSADPGMLGGRRARILIGDDDPDIRALLRELIEENGQYTVVESGTGAEALAQLTAADESARPDIALLDIRLPDLDGLEVLQQLHDQGLSTPVIFMTGYSSASLAIRAIQLKAADYLAKPFVDLDKVLAAVDRQWRYLCAAQRSQSWTQAAVPDPNERMVGSDDQMIQVYKTLGQVARTRATVLITGETGTGKERAAEALHLASDRRKGPLIKVNCAAISEHLLESELFGHEKGAYTGAVGEHKGLFEAADKGTIFLDEVGEMTLDTQKKLLRVLQEREVMRVGSTKPIPVDVRVVAATSKNLRAEVQRGTFRDDLYYRLNVIAIHLPPLRARKGDIPVLVQHFLAKYRPNPTALPDGISEEAMERLLAYDWPGNVRELEHCIERAALLSRGRMITADLIALPEEPATWVVDVGQRVREGAGYAALLHEVGRAALQTALQEAEGSPEQAAAHLHLSLDEFTQECQAHDIRLEGGAERS